MKWCGLFVGFSSGEMNVATIMSSCLVFVLVCEKDKVESFGIIGADALLTGYHSCCTTR